MRTRSLTTGKTAMTRSLAYAGASVFLGVLIGLNTVTTFGETSAAEGPSVLLPIYAPIPTPRPEDHDLGSAGQESLHKQDRLRQASQPLIGTTPQPIPPARQNVRAVGWAFLPDFSEQTELVGEADARAEDAAEAAANEAAKLEQATETVAALSLGQSERRQ